MMSMFECFWVHAMIYIDVYKHSNFCRIVWVLNSGEFLKAHEKVSKKADLNYLHLNNLIEE